ncbi:MAG: hypothetical protein HZC41_11245 [Chloroflexi bacterium]|nr:hypothetical protein [Chloroflexota bacterium]
MMFRYRVLFAFVLISWLVVTLFLLLSPLNLVSIRFASDFGLIWFGWGLGLAALLLIAFGRRSARLGRAEHYAAIAAYLSEGVIICNARGRVQWANEAAAELVNGKFVLDSARAVLERARTTRRIAIQNVALGEGLRLSVQAVPLNRGMYALICKPLGVDGTRSAFYENFIRRIVHDMRNPLAAIIGHAANIRQAPLVDPAAWHKAAGTIENEAQRLARLVDSMLFDARLAYVPLEPTMLDLVDVLEEAVYSRDEMAQQEGKTLEIEAPPEPMRAEGDRDLLARAFENLIDNSLKYSETGARVQVRLEQQPGCYVISFVDNGIGIPPEYLPDRIFEPLVRARSQKMGSGLGLSISKKIVEMHSGSISVQSKVGVGTTMTVRLPKPGEVDR